MPGPAPVAMPSLLRSAAPWIAVAICAGGFMAVLGPFGSYLNDGLALRAGYWIAGMLLGLGLYVGALKLAERIAPPGSRGRWPVLVGATLLAGVPEAVATRTAAFWLWPELAGLGLSWPLWFAQTTTIGVAGMALALFVRHRRSAPSQGAPVHRPMNGPPANPLPGDVLALQMEDHYVRVHTPRGSELVLMPLSRAMERIEAPGLRVHRSWWVARHAVTAVEGDPRAMRLHLSNGVVAPVARSAVAQLKAAGWLPA